MFKGVQDISVLQIFVSQNYLGDIELSRRHRIISETQSFIDIELSHRIISEIQSCLVELFYRYGIVLQIFVSKICLIELFYRYFVSEIFVSKNCFIGDIEFYRYISFIGYFVSQNYLGDIELSRRYRVLLNILSRRIVLQIFCLK